MPDQQNATGKTYSSLTCIEVDILFKAMLCIKDIDSKGEDRIDFDKLADVAGYPNAESMRAQWRTMQDILTEITVKAEDADTMGVSRVVTHVDGISHGYTAPLSNDGSRKHAPKLPSKNTKASTKTTNSKPKKNPKKPVGIHKLPPNYTPRTIHRPAKNRIVTAEQMAEEFQVSYDKGLIEVGFGRTTAFGSIRIPPPPSGFGFGLGVYSDYDNDEDNTFLAWKDSAPSPTPPSQARKSGNRKAVGLKGKR